MHVPLTANENTVNDLIDSTALHGSMIEPAALGMIFRIKHLRRIARGGSRLLLPTSACRRRPDTGRLISDRGALLERAIRSLKRQSRRTEIVVHDNGSTSS